MKNKKSPFLTVFRRAPFQSLTAFLVTFFSLFLGYIFFFVAAGSSQILHYFETRPQINAYFKADYIPTPEEITVAKTALEQTHKTLSVNYVTKDQALEIYKNLNSSDPLLLEAVTASMLPASIEVQAISPKDLKDLAAYLKSLPNIEEVSYAEDLVSSLETWTNSVRLVGLILVGVLLIISLMVMILIIGLKISSKKSDIVTQQLLGAHRGFIVLPYVREGFIYGLSAAVAAWLVAYLLLLYSTPFLVKFLAGLPVLPVPWIFLLSTFAGGVALGSAMGSLAGLLAVQRFLRS